MRYKYIKICVAFLCVMCLFFVFKEVSCSQPKEKLVDNIFMRRSAGNKISVVHIVDEGVDVKNVVDTDDEGADVKNVVDTDDELTSVIRSSFKKKITFDIDVYPTLSSRALQIAYERNLTLEGRGDDYSLIIKGEDIQDYSVDLDMGLEIKEYKKEGLSNSYMCVRNSKDKLPGKVYIKIRNNKYFKNNVYLYNKIKGTYDLLDVKDMTWQMDENMRVLLTNTDINKKELNYTLLMYVGIGIVSLIILYILIKKKYWFW